MSRNALIDLLLSEQNVNEQKSLLQQQRQQQEEEEEHHHHHHHQQQQHEQQQKRRETHLSSPERGSRENTDNFANTPLEPNKLTRDVWYDVERSGYKVDPEHRHHRGCLFIVHVPSDEAHNINFNTAENKIGSGKDNNNGMALNPNHTAGTHGEENTHSGDTSKTHTTQLSDLTKDALDKLLDSKRQHHSSHTSQPTHADNEEFMKQPFIQHPTTHETEVQQQKQELQHEQQEKIKAELQKDSDSSLAQFAYLTDKERRVAEGTQKTSDSPTRASSGVRLLSESDAEPTSTKKMYQSQLQAMKASLTPPTPEPQPQPEPTAKVTNATAHSTSPEIVSPSASQQQLEQLRSEEEQQQQQQSKEQHELKTNAQLFAKTENVDLSNLTHKAAGSSIASSVLNSHSANLGITPAASSTTSSVQSSTMPRTPSVNRATHPLGLSLSGRLEHISPTRCFIVWASYDYLEQKHPALMPADDNDKDKKKHQWQTKATNEERSSSESHTHNSEMQHAAPPLPTTLPLSRNEHTSSPLTSNSSSSSSSSSSAFSLSSNSSLWSPYQQVSSSDAGTGNKANAHESRWQPKLVEGSSIPHRAHALQTNNKDTRNNDNNNNNNNNNTLSATKRNSTNDKQQLVDAVQNNVHYDEEGVCVAENDVIVLKASELIEMKIVSAPFESKEKKATVVTFIAPDRCAELCNLTLQENNTDNNNHNNNNHNNNVFVSEVTPLLHKHKDSQAVNDTKDNDKVISSDEMSNPLHKEQETVMPNPHKRKDQESKQWDNENDVHTGHYDNNNVNDHHMVEYTFALLRGGAVKLSDALRAVRPDLNTDIILGSPRLSIAQDKESNEHRSRSNVTEQKNNNNNGDGNDNNHNNRAKSPDKKESSLLGRAFDMVKNVVVPIPHDQRQNEQRAEERRELPHNTVDKSKEQYPSETRHVQQQTSSLPEQQQHQHEKQQQHQKETSLEVTDSSEQHSPSTPPPSPESQLGKWFLSSKRSSDTPNNNEKMEEKNRTQENKLTSNNEAEVEHPHQLEQQEKQRKEEEDQKRRLQEEEQQSRKQQELQEEKQRKEEEDQKRRLQEEEQQSRKQQELEEEKQRKEEEDQKRRLQEEEEQQSRKQLEKQREKEQLEKAFLQSKEAEKEHILQVSLQELLHSEEKEREHDIQAQEQAEEEELQQQWKKEHDELNARKKDTDVKQPALPDQTTEMVKPSLKPSQLEMGSPLSTFDWQSCFVNDDKLHEADTFHSLSISPSPASSPTSRSPHQESSTVEKKTITNSNQIPDVQLPNDKGAKPEQIIESDQKHEVEEEHEEVKNDKVISEELKMEQAAEGALPAEASIPTQPVVEENASKHLQPKQEQSSPAPSPSTSSPPLSAAGQTLSPSQQRESQLHEQELHSLQKSALHISPQSEALSQASVAASMEVEEREDESNTIRVESKYQKAREKAYFGGVEDYVRFEVWTHLLEVYSPTLCFSERAKVLQDNEQLFRHLTAQWQTVLPIQEQHWRLYREQRDALLNDVIKLQSTNTAFSDVNAPKMRGVRKLLMAHLMYDFDFGYAHGMNEVAALCSLISPCEEMSFLCYRALMVQQLRSGFSKDDSGDNLAHKLQQVRLLIRHFNKPLFDYLVSIHADDMTVCARWLQTMFVSEFPINEVKKLWDVILACPFTNHFDIFVTAALLDAFSETIRTKLSTHETLLQFNSHLSGNVEISEVILYSQLFYNKVCEELQRLVSSEIHDSNASTQDKITTNADKELHSETTETLKDQTHSEQLQQSQEQKLSPKQEQTSNKKLAKPSKTFTIDEIEHVLLQKDGNLEEENLIIPPKQEQQ